jgi:hypothetical protein
VRILREASPWTAPYRLLEMPTKGVTDR